MNQNKNRSIKKVKGVFVIIGVIALVSLLGTSYAWYQLTTSGTKGINVTSGVLDIDFTDSEGVIYFDKAEPMTSADGLKTDAIKIVLDNKSDMDAEYTLYLDDLDLASGDSRMPDQYIKYNINGDGNNSFISTIDNTDSTIVDGNTSRVLKVGEVSHESKKTLNIRFWINEDAPNSVMGKKFKAKIRVVNTQKVESE